MSNQPSAILARFPDKCHLLTLRMSEDAEFYALCLDHEICVEALNYWSTSDKPEANVRQAEYRRLVQELETEIVADLQS